MIPAVLQRVLQRYKGPPAPVARASQNEIERSLETVRTSPILDTLLQWVNGFIFVLNPQRQVVATGKRVPETTVFSTADDLIGKRPGEVLGCIHAGKGPGGCGTSEACRHCGALCGISMSQASADPVAGECRITTRGKDGEISGKYSLRATTIPLQDQTFTLLFFQNSLQAWQHPTQSIDLAPRKPAGFPGYETQRLLGKGAMGSVYLVHDEAGNEYALKALHPHLLAEDGMAARFSHENEITLKLGHPNTVRTFATAVADDGRHFMVSEYCPNGCLYRQLQRLGPIPSDLALFWMIEAARGLEYVWTTHQVVHRDIKPDNLLLTEDNRVKIADFGIARLAPEMARLTEAGTIIGTPSYMSPEVAESADSLDAGADLYSLGASFYHLTTGELPFVADSALGVLKAAATRPLTPVRQHNPDVPEVLAGTIEWLMEKERSNRPAEPAALLKHLHKAAAELDVDTAAAPRYFMA